MLGIYLATLGFGAILIGLSLVFGGGDTDKDVVIDKDLDLDKDVDLAKDLVLDKDVSAAGDAVWAPLLSMRFWTFAALTFGLTGTLLTLLAVGQVLTAILSSLVGLTIGVGAAWMFRQLKTDEVSAQTSLHRLAGEDARVLLPIRPGQHGKIVVDALAGRIELPATSQDARTIEAGATVIVASVRHGVADVSALTGPAASSQAAREAARAPSGSHGRPSASERDQEP